MPTTLTLSTTTFYNRQPLANVNAITFTNPFGSTAQAVFAGSQIRFDQVDTHSLITGSAGINQLVIVGRSVVASNFTFANWSRSDLVWIKGTTGEDVIHGSAVRDLIETGDSNDFIYAHDGSSVASDTVRAGAGDDHITIDHAGSIDGGIGNDTWHANLGSLAQSISVDLRNGGSLATLPFSLTLTSIERLDLDLGGGNDNVWGGGLDDQINGGAGNDVLNGEGGRDSLISGAGANTLMGGLGDDALYTAGSATAVADGGDGSDFVGIDLRQVTTDQVIDLRDGGGGRSTGTGIQILNAEGIGGFAGQGNDVIWNGARDANISACDGNDLVHGGLGADVIDGGRGRDTLFGEGGDDYLFVLGGLVAGGDATNRDSMDGGDGNDVLQSGSGRQDMWGGTGADSFYFASASALNIGATADRVLDFEHGIDKIEFNTDGGFPGLDGVVHFIGASPFTSGLTTQARVIDTATETVMVLGNTLLGVIGQIHFGQHVVIDAGDVIA